MNARDIIERLALAPHPEGGHFRETWVADAPEGQRPAGTAIYFLLQAGERSHWHRVDADEVWHFHAGAPLRLSISPDAEGPARVRTLGADLEAGMSPQIIVPANHWQSAETTGVWTLLSCTVCPGFRLDGFDLAPEDFDIP